jgi:hypothetical protein
VNPTVEDEYWSTNYQAQPYYDRSLTYDDYRPAYEYGWSSYRKHGGTAKSYGEVESELERNWNRVKGESRLTWEKAKLASRDAWNRVERAIPGDLDRDGN